MLRIERIDSRRWTDAVATAAADQPSILPILPILSAFAFQSELSPLSIQTVRLDAC
jgi:hypothetical protein